MYQNNNLFLDININLKGIPIWHLQLSTLILIVTQIILLCNDGKINFNFTCYIASTLNVSRERIYHASLILNEFHSYLLASIEWAILKGIKFPNAFKTK